MDVAQSHSYTVVNKICLKRKKTENILYRKYNHGYYIYIIRVVLNYETKSKRNERNEMKYYETQRNILNCEMKSNATKRNLL